MNETIINDETRTNIKEMIYTIRGLQVMLDSDLAKLYGYEVKRLNEQVKRNIERFPEDFMFQLNEKEITSLWSQNATANISTKSRSTPYAFTEQGVYMLSTVLKGEMAVRQSIMIMRVFKEMRHYLLENKSLLESDSLTRLVMQTNQNTKDIIEIKENMATKDDISRIMDNFIDETKIKEFVFVDGQKFEADEAYISIYKLAKKSIYVVDDYVSIKTLSHLKQVNNGIEVTIFTDNRAGRSKLTLVELNDFESQYFTVKLKATNNMVHDRLIVLDYGLSNEKIYLCGASSKDAGSKFCTILEVHHKNNYYEIIEQLKMNDVLVL